jgi:hypothetical protein
MHLEKYRQGRYWAVYDDTGMLICVTLYKKGAQEVVRRLQGVNGHRPPPPDAPTGLSPTTRRRWRRALAIAAILLDEEGSHSQYLRALSHYLIQR